MTESPRFASPIGYLLKLLIISAFALIQPPLLAQSTFLTPKEARHKIQEILHSHAEYRDLTPEIAGRTLDNFLEELDPLKTYLLQNEVVDWTSPTPELLAEVVAQIRKCDFSLFTEKYLVFQSAVARRQCLEGVVDTLALPEKVSASEFRHLDWCDSEAALTNRLLRIRALQKGAVAALEETNQDQFFQKITKRRLRREDELLPLEPAERENAMLTHVLKSVSSALDSQTHYFTPIEASQFMMQIQQKLYGIGAQLRDNLNGFTIVRILEGSPASRSHHIRTGDRIIAINGELVVGLEIEDAVELIRGPEGSEVVLTLVREVSGGDNDPKEENLTVTLTRGEVVLTERRYDSSWTPYGDGGIGIIQLYSFYQDSDASSSRDVAEAIRALEQQRPLKGVILDMRENPGGVLPQAVALCGLFVQKGVIVSIKDHRGELQHLRNLEDSRVWNGPLVVLLSRASASAAEIVAQTLKDYGRAIIVGDATTFGKGTYQTFTLEAAHYGRVNPLGEYKVTRGKWYSVGGLCPQIEGVAPHIIVPGPLSRAEFGEQFAKYPLATDTIAPNFDDPMDDIPWVQRAYVQRIYRAQQQTVLHDYDAFLPILRENSEKRLMASANYKNFLKAIESEEPSQELLDQIGQNDLQLDEAVQVMKDLVFLTDKARTQAAA